MNYYRVKPEYGGTTAFKFARGGGLRVVGQYVANELYTKTELKRRGDCLYHNYLEPVEISKNNVFWNFGCRFECKGDN